MKRIDGSYIFFLFFHFIRDFTLSIFNFSRCDPSPRSRFFLFLFFFFSFLQEKEQIKNDPLTTPGKYHGVL